MDDIKTPEELLDFMFKNIRYGYLGKNGKLYFYDDPDFEKDWFDQSIIQSPEELLKNGCGNCLDQVEFERNWFIKHNYNIETIFTMVMLDYKNNYPIHSFLAYQDEDDNWCWFENADFNNRGIHKFDTLEELLRFQRRKFIEGLKTLNITDQELRRIITTKFLKPDAHLSMPNYIDYVTNFDNINI